jgi:hypothetical protein
VAICLASILTAAAILPIRAVPLFPRWVAFLTARGFVRLIRTKLSSLIATGQNETSKQLFQIRLHMSRRAVDAQRTAT